MINSRIINRINNIYKPETKQESIFQNGKGIRIEFAILTSITVITYSLLIIFNLNELRPKWNEKPKVKVNQKEKNIGKTKSKT